MNTDPLTGRPLPPTAIQRVLYLAPKVHVYQIPPATSTKGYQASTWTADGNKRQIFTARLRVVETSIPKSSLPAGHPALASRTNSGPTSGDNADDEDEVVTTTLLLEDPSTGDLFAAAPYTSPAAVEQALDSSRFFAITVIGEGRKAVLGMGFEERSEAFDFSIALQDARRVLGFDKSDPQNSAHGRGRNAKPVKEEPKRDFSLKEGETISINLGGLKGRRARAENSDAGSADPWATTSGKAGSETDALFSIKPPPGPGGATPFLPPPPSAKSVKEERRRSRQTFEERSAQDLGFDDGEFGEFQ